MTCGVDGAGERAELQAFLPRSLLQKFMNEARIKTVARANAVYHGRVEEGALMIQ